MLDVIALQIWPDVVAARCKLPKQIPSPTLIIAENGIVNDAVQGSDPVTEQSEVLEGEMNSSQSGPEIQNDKIRPSPPRGAG